MRKCKKCGLEKEIEQFPKYKAKGFSGYRHVCKICWNKKWSPIIVIHNKRYYDEKVSYRTKAIERAGKQYERERNNGTRTLNYKLYEKRYPERAKVKVLVMMAIRSGKIKAKPCLLCGKKPHAHHDDYSKPFDILWLCPKHHFERHRIKNRIGDWPTDLNGKCCTDITQFPKALQVRGLP